jgi:hypothetical protein
MTKRIVFFGAPTRGTAGAGAATSAATRTVAGAPEGPGGAVLSADQSAKVPDT